MAKIIDFSNRTEYKPSNKTAAMLLYLLRRDNGDEIHFNTLKDKVKQKYGFNDVDAASKVNNFLTKLDNFNILDDRPALTRPGTNNPDPLDLFNNQEQWDQDPDLLIGSGPICRASHYYSTGYIMITIRR